MEGVKEGVRPEQIEFLNAWVEGAQSCGVTTECILAYGSRARGDARFDSDLDLVILLDFHNWSFPDNHSLLQTRSNSHHTVRVSTQVGIMHAIMVDGPVARRFLRLPNLCWPDKDLLKNISRDAKVIYGKEPLVGGKPLTEYVRQRI